MKIRKSKLTNLSLLAFLCMIIIFACSVAGASELSGFELRAASVALEVFRKEQPSADLSFFKVEITQLDNQIKVLFIPELTPEERARFIGHRGGGNIHGLEVEFLLSSDGQKLIKRSFFR